MNDGMTERMLGRARELGLNSPRALSLAAGLGPTTIRDMMSRPGASPRLKTVERIAAALRTTPEWLMSGREGLNSFQTLAGTEAPPANALRLARTTYGGVVETEAYRPAPAADHWPDEAPSLALPGAPDLPLMVFDVAGNGMDALRPVPILQGMRVIGFDAAALSGHLQLHNGMVVVAERRLGERLRELSLRQVEIRPAGPVFMARSSDARCEPIIPGEMADEPNGSVRVVAIVRRAILEL